MNNFFNFIKKKFSCTEQIMPPSLLIFVLKSNFSYIKRCYAGNLRNDINYSICLCLKIISDLWRKMSCSCILFSMPNFHYACPKYQLAAYIWWVTSLYCIWIQQAFIVILNTCHRSCHKCICILISKCKQWIVWVSEK